MKMIHILLFSLSLLLPVDGFDLKTLNHANFKTGMIPQEDVRARLNAILDLTNILEDHEIVVLNLWGTWCKPCIEEIPELNELVRDYSNKGVRFLAFSDEDPTRLEKFNLDNYNKKRPDLRFNYKQIFGNREATSYIKSMNTQVDGNPVPIHVLLKKDGTLGQVLIGASPAYNKVIRDFLDNEIIN